MNNPEPKKRRGRPPGSTNKPKAGRERELLNELKKIETRRAKIRKELARIFSA